MLRTLLPPRAGCPLFGLGCGLLPEMDPGFPAGGFCWRTELLPCDAGGRLAGAALLPLRLTLPLGRLCEGALCWEDMEGWLLRGAEPSPLVLPEGPELRVWGDGADIEEEGRPPPLLRELPPPDPPRELLPPLVWASRGTAIIAAAAKAIRESVVKRFIIV